MEFLRGLYWDLSLFPYLCSLLRNNISFHCYANDTGWSPPFQLSSQALQIALTDIKNRVCAYFLKLNWYKTEILIIGSDELLPSTKSSIGLLCIYMKSAVRNLGVLFDYSLTFKRHICKICFYHLGNIVIMQSTLTHRLLLMYLFSLW